MRGQLSRKWIALVLIAFFLASCSSNTETPLPENDNEVILTFIGPGGPSYLTLADLKALPQTEGMAGIISSTGMITIPELYQGVALQDLIAAYSDSFDATMGLTLTAVDGYSMTYSYAQVMEGDFIAYDPAIGNELGEHDPLTAVLAYARNGEPLDPVQDGTLRLVVVSETNNQVTDGHWSVKWVNKVEIASVGSTWTLEMEGAILSEIDRASYQSCASPGCHGIDYEDDNGQTWSGVPLWLLVGEVDDADSHSDTAFSDALADEGYTVEVIAEDGYSTTFESEMIKYNGNILVAYLVNRSELPDEYYPLRLVGGGLEKNQLVGQIVKIIIHFP